MSITTEIHITDGSPICRIVRGPNAQVSLSTPVAVGMALLQSATAAAGQQATAGIDASSWTDLLSSHGVAIGRVRGAEVTLAVLPPKQREVSFGEQRVICTFPHIFMCLATRTRRYANGLIFVFDPRNQARVNVVNGPECLTPFPYGNIYGDSGRICWGSVRHGDIKTIAEMESAFFTSGFNTDLWGIRSHGNLPALVAASPNGVIAPPTGFGTTVAQAISRLTTGI